MSKPVLLPFLSLALLCVLPGAGLAAAEGITISNGGTLTLSGGTLDLNCQSVLVEDGGSMQLVDGIVRDKQALTVQPVGLYDKAESVQVFLCGRNFYLQLTPEGKPVLYTFPKQER